MWQKLVKNATLCYITCSSNPTPNHETTNSDFLFHENEVVYLWRSGKLHCFDNTTVRSDQSKKAGEKGPADEYDNRKGRAYTFSYRESWLAGLHNLWELENYQEDAKQSQRKSKCIRGEEWSYK